MMDKEKIEKGLRCCIDGDHCNSTECPYYDAAPNIQGCTQALCQDVLRLLKEQEPVVRCKDCKHGEEVNSVYLCGKIRGFGLAHEPDWFCADGERQEVNESEG